MRVVFRGKRCSCHRPRRTRCVGSVGVAWRTAAERRDPLGARATCERRRVGLAGPVGGVVFSRRTSVAVLTMRCSSGHAANENARFGGQLTRPRRVHPQDVR